MKLAIFALLAILAAAYSTAEASNIDILRNHLNDFEPLIPKKKIILIGAKHMIFDRQFRNARKFFGTEQSRELIVKIMKSKPFQQMVADLEQDGIEAKDIINEFARTLNFPTFPESFDIDESIESRNLGTFLNDVIKALPRQQIGDLIRQKVRNSPYFSKLYNKGISDKFQQQINGILAYPPLAPTFAIFRSNGIDVKDIHNAANTILSWGK